MVRGPVRGEYPPVLVAVRGQGGDRHAGWLCWYWPLLSPHCTPAGGPGSHGAPHWARVGWNIPGVGRGGGGSTGTRCGGDCQDTPTLSLSLGPAPRYTLLLSFSLLLSLLLFLFLSALHSLHHFYLKYEL